MGADGTSQAWSQATGDRGWRCPFSDDLGQWCVLGRGHDGAHGDGGLRAWIEQTTATAIIRIYEGPESAELQQIEQVVFEQYGWRPIAGDDSTRVAYSGPSADGIAVLGSLAALSTSFVPQRRIVTCYARPPLITG
jgi:hypothetical protein